MHEIVDARPAASKVQESIPEDANEKTIEWKKFLGPVAFTPFNLQKYFQWRCYWEYSNGIGSDLMVHQVDEICCIMDVTMPKSVVSSGGIYRWKDNRTTPDTWTAAMEFEDEGFQINYHARFNNTTDNNKQYGVLICGTDGAIEIDLHHKLYVKPEESWLRNKDVQPYESQFGKDIPDATDGAVRKHLENWVDCIKSRKTPNCDVETGFFAAAIAAMSITSYKEGKRVLWDKKKQEAYT